MYKYLSLLLKVGSSYRICVYFGVQNVCVWTNKVSFDRRFNFGSEIILSRNRYKMPTFRYVGNWSKSVYNIVPTLEKEIQIPNCN